MRTQEKQIVITRRELLSMGCALAASAALPRCGGSQTGLPTAAAKSGDADQMQYVNPEFRPALEALLAHKRPLPEMPLLDHPPVEERLIPGLHGAPPVRIFITGHDSRNLKPAVLHIHGGGYTSGSAAEFRGEAQALALSLNCVVAVVDYRLAPQTRFPGSLEDNYAALTWLYMHSEELGVDRKRIAVKGESAGGGHVAALAIHTRNRGEIPLCAQILIEPMLDDRTGSSRSVPLHQGHFIWTARNNRYGWSSLLGVPAGSADVPVNSVPARVDNLNGLPPTFLGVGSIDLFAEEDIVYAQRLIAAGVPVELRVVPGAYHGFDIFAPDAPMTLDFVKGWHDALRRAFGANRKAS